MTELNLCGFCQIQFMMTPSNEGIKATTINAANVLTGGSADLLSDVYPSQAYLNNQYRNTDLLAGTVVRAQAHSKSAVTEG